MCISLSVCVCVAVLICLCIHWVPLFNVICVCEFILSDDDDDDAELLCADCLVQYVHNTSCSRSRSPSLFLYLFLCFSHYSSILHISIIFLFFSLLFVFLQLSFCLVFCTLSLNVMIINKSKWNAHISAFYELVKLEQRQQQQQQITSHHIYVTML